MKQLLQMARDAEKKTPGSKWTKFVQGGCWHGTNRAGRKIDDEGYRKETMIN